MKSKLTILILVFIAAAITGRLAFAQTSAVTQALDEREQSPQITVTYSPEFSGLEDISKIKTEVEGLLKENQTLEVQYKWLKDELAGLEKSISDEKENIEQIKKDFGVSDASEAIKKGSTYSFDEVEDNLLIEESKKDLAAAKAMDTDETKRLWELKLADLQFQKRQLELEVKMATMNCKENEDARRQDLDRLNKILDENQTKEKKLQGQIASLQENAEVSPEALSDLIRKNKSLEQQVKEKQNDIDYLRKENGLLEDKKAYILKSADYGLGKLKEQKLVLDNLINDLNRQYDGLNQVVGDSFERQKRINDYMQQVIAIDKENQQLRQQIADTQKKIDELK